MYRIVNKEVLAPQLKLIEVRAPEVASKNLPGQFVILKIGEKGERIPLTIAGKNLEKGTITIIFQEVGKTTKLLGSLQVNDFLSDLVGPLGRPTELKNYGTVVCIGGGVGVAEVYPITKALKEAGNKTVGIIGARQKQLLFFLEEMKRVCDEFYTTTDDGSYGEKGFVSNVLERLVKEKKIDLVYAIGPLPMMRVVCQVTKPLLIKTIVSLNPVMVDGTGMCGACRVSVGGVTKFACVDGPEFDGHQVDWDELEARLRLFIEQEKIALHTLES